MTSNRLYKDNHTFLSFPPVCIEGFSSIHPEGAGKDGCMYAVEPDYKLLIPNSSLRRRMSRAVKMGVACGLECLKEVTAEDVGAILTATGWGCLGDTQKFMDSLTDNHEQFLNPTPFMQSTFNTVGAQIALCKGIHACNMTYVQKGHSFENVLIDAVLHVSEGKDAVLVGAFDELTSFSTGLLSRLKFPKPMGEGAQFFLLRNPDKKRRESLKKSRGIYLKSTGIFWGHHTPDSVCRQMLEFLSANDIAASEVNLFINGRMPEGENRVYDCLERRLNAAVSMGFKDECGESPTAVSYALWKACRLLQSTYRDRHCSLLIYNNFLGREHSFILVENICGC